MIGKLIVHARDREAALVGMRNALAEFTIEGIHTTIPFHQAVLAHPDFANNRVTTSWVDNELMNELYARQVA
jgi:acetyl-CoA carboxylase biotin carboxylase subunit